MSERIKLCLTRNRLFEFDNCLCFCGSYNKGFDVEEANKALKMLFAANELLSGAAELCEDGTAYVVTGKVLPYLEITDKSANELLLEYTRNGIDFEEKLFSFALSQGKAFMIFAHTAVADCRTLMYLAEEFMAFYKKIRLSVEPENAELFDDLVLLPSNVFSPLIDRIASDLEVGWQKKTEVFNGDDYRRGRGRYISNKSEISVIEKTLSKEEMKKLQSFAEANNTDVSSLVAFAFYEALCLNVQGKRKFMKMNVTANERVFFEKSYRVGPFDGLVCVALKKNKKLTDISQKAVEFHKEIYKKLTSSFAVFYTDVLHSKIPPSFCDSAYMCCAGEFKHKYSKRLAHTYGCANEVMGEFSSYNIDQHHWHGLRDFDNVTLTEPFKMRCASKITFTCRNGQGTILFAYKSAKISSDNAEQIVEKALETIKLF